MLSFPTELGSAGSRFAQVAAGLGWVGSRVSPLRALPFLGVVDVPLGGVVLAGSPGSSSSGRGAVFGEAFCPGGDGRRRGATPWPA